MRADRTPRGRPAFAASQREKILELLRAAGPRGVRREALIFQHRWTQVGTRIHELEQMGYRIRHEVRPGERFVVYVLESEPLELRPLVKPAHSHDDSGQSPKNTDPQANSVLPLFDSVVRR
jgi:hypothetical protein